MALPLTDGGSKPPQNGGDSKTPQIEEESKTPQSNTGSKSSPGQSSCLIPYLDPATATGNVKATLDSMPYVRNIFLLLGHSSGLHPPLMDVYKAAFNKDKRKLPLLDWLLVVLRVAARLDAPYPWDVNEPVARLNGMGAARLDAMGAPSKVVQADAGSVWTMRDKAILALVDEQLTTYTNESATVKGARQLMSDEELVEIYILLGVYVLIARITRGLRIDLDAEIPGLEESLKKMIQK